MESPDLREMVKAFLEEHGYDGLYDEDRCGCTIDDLMPCDNPWQWCIAGYRVRLEDGGWGIGPRRETETENPDTKADVDLAHSIGLEA